MPTHHMCWGHSGELTLVSGKLWTHKSWQPVPDLKSLQSKWKIKTQIGKGLGKWQVMWLVQDRAALVSEPELTSGVWCSGDRNGLTGRIPYSQDCGWISLLVLLCSHRLRMKNFVHGFLVVWGWFFCFVLLVQYRHLRNGIHTKTISYGLLGR